MNCKCYITTDISELRNKSVFSVRRFGLFRPEVANSMKEKNCLEQIKKLKIALSKQVLE